MMVEAVVFTELRSLVGDRCYPSAFPQAPDLPTWPAIRYTVVSQDTEPVLCGTGDTSADDVRVQLDIVAKTHGAVIVLRNQVIDALMETDPPCIRLPGGFQTWDVETKTHRAVMDYLFQPSSIGDDVRVDSDDVLRFDSDDIVRIIQR